MGTVKEHGLSVATASNLMGVSPSTLVKLIADSPNPPQRVADSHPTKGSLLPRDFGRWWKEYILAEAGYKAEDLARTTPNFQEEKARLTKAQADRAEVDAAIAQGRAVRADVMVLYWAGILSNLKTRMLAVGNKTAPRARACETDAEAKALIDDEIMQALNDVSAQAIPTRADLPDDAAALVPSEDTDTPSGAPVSKKVGRPKGSTKNK